MSEPTIYHQIENIGELHPIPPLFDAWFWSAILLSLVLIAIAIYHSKGYVSSLIKTLFLNRYLHQSTQQEIKLTGLTSILLTINYFIAASLLIYQLFDLQGDGFLIPILFAIILVISLIKMFVMKITSFLTQTRRGILEHLMNHMISYQLIGILFIPLLILTYFFPEPAYHVLLLIFTGILILLVLVREFQSLIHAIGHRISLFYIILYLCTLEILPLILAIQVLADNNIGFN